VVSKEAVKINNPTSMVFNMLDEEISKVLSNSQRLIVTLYSVEWTKSGKPKMAVYRTAHFIVIERQGSKWYNIGKRKIGASKNGQLFDNKELIDDPAEWIRNCLVRGYVLCDINFKPLLFDNAYWEKEVDRANQL